MPSIATWFRRKIVWVAGGVLLIVAAVLLASHWIPISIFPWLTPTRELPAPTPGSIATIRLRSEPLTVSSEEDAVQKFALTERKLERKFERYSDWISVSVPQTYITNQYEKHGEVVVDHATGLMWQKSGSKDGLTHQDAQKYIEQLNQQKFAGYSDWRLPTIPELMSLLEPEMQSNKSYINPLFDTKQNCCWSADMERESGSPFEYACFVIFPSGFVGWESPTDNLYARAVRSWQ